MLSDRHKLYRAFPKSRSDVDYLDKLLKQGDAGVSKNTLVQTQNCLKMTSTLNYRPNIPLYRRLTIISITDNYRSIGVHYRLSRL